MRLKHVFISEYKNLKDFSLDLESDNFVDIFVGKNGCGKSNFLEALVEIFQHIMSLGESSQPEIYFNYTIKYEIAGEAVKLEWLNQEMFINNFTRVRRTMGSTPTIDALLMYYSGHNDTVSALVSKYDERFRTTIKDRSVENVRELVYVGPEYKEILLTVLLMQEDGVTSKEYLMEALGIRNIGLRRAVSTEGEASYEYTQPVLKLGLQRPQYARGSNSREYDIINRDAEHRFWKAKGKTIEFLDHLNESLVNPEGFTLTNGYSDSDDTYTLYVDIEALKGRLLDYEVLDFFHAFDMLKTLGMLADLEVPISLESDVEASISHFSDGQFQSIYIYAVTELFKDIECLTLLDEPDAFLHPEWQHNFFNQVDDISKDASNSNHILMTSHSAITLIPSQSEKINYIDLKDGKTNPYRIPKRVAITKLSNNILQYHEEESLLSIINTIQIENKPVFFTEGNSDPVIIKEAWYKLFDGEEIPFIPFYAFSCTYINQLITDERIHREMNGLPIFALFDFDNAYNQWNGLNGEVLLDDPARGMLKKWENGESYAFMLPIPDNPVIHSQVYKDIDQKVTFLDKSNCAIEHLFYGVEGLEGNFRTEPSPGGEQIFFAGNKIDFAKTVVPNLPREAFEVFRPLFEQVKNICPRQEMAA